MKKDQVNVGHIYVAKISDKLTRVRIDSVSPHGGWEATNLATNKKVRIKSPAKLRGPVPEKKAASQPAPAATPVKVDTPVNAQEAERKPYRLGQTARVELLTEKQAKARNLARSDGQKWQIDEAAAGQAARVTLPPAGEERKALEAEGRRKDRSAAIAAAQQAAAQRATENAAKAQRVAETRREFGKMARQRSAERGPSGLDVAAQLLKESAQPMNTKQMVEVMLAKGLWKTNGKTPAATIYAAILREIQTKAGEARFKKTDRGLFTINAK
jgi:hypothetical protein